MSDHRNIRGMGIRRSQRKRDNCRLVPRSSGRPRIPQPGATINCGILLRRWNLFAKCTTRGTVYQTMRCPRSNSGKMLLMDRRDAYLLKAAELTALAENSRYPAFKVHFENLALAYVR